MKIALIGATGGTGQRFLVQALAQGHEVRALARRPDHLPPATDRFTVVRGGLLDRGCLEEVLIGASAVFFAAGVSRFSEVLRVHRGGAFFSPVGRALIAAMAAAGVPRLVAITSLGVVDTTASPWFYRHVIKGVLLQPVYDDMLDLEAQLDASPLEWTIIRPPKLTDGPRTPYRVFREGALPRLLSVSRADVADLALAEIVQPKHVRARVCVATS